MNKKIFVITGEKSGDLLGSKIIQNLKDFDIYGIGGELMLENGLKKSLFPMEEISLMGFFEVIPKIFKLLKRIRETAKYIINLKPDIVLTIDSPDFCFRVMKLVKKFDKEKKIKKIHFIAPSVWAYRKKRAEKISKIYDLLFCILPFEPPYFEKYGLKTIFVGHPIFDRSSNEYTFNTEKNDYNHDSKIISITVGSRKSEINRFFPIIIDLINKIKNNYYDFKYYLIATNYTYDLLLEKIKDFKENNDIIITKDKDIIKKSKIAIAKSGTNTLEIAAYSIPMIVFYKFNMLTNIIAKKIRKNGLKYANIINIINNKQIIPECLIENCNSKKMFIEFKNLIQNKEILEEQIKNNESTLKILGYKNNNNSAEIIANEIRSLCVK